MAEPTPDDRAELVALARVRMPYGKYAGQRIMDLPEPYLVWLVRNALPSGTLGRRLQAMYEIKLNGLEGLLRPLREDPR